MLVDWYRPDLVKFLTTSTVVKAAPANHLRNMGAEDSTASLPHRATPTFNLHLDGNGIDIGHWQITSAQRPIAATAVEDRLAADLSIKLPAMLFDCSTLQLQYRPPSPLSAESVPAFELVFSAIDALRMVGEADPNIKVKAADKWGAKTDRHDVEISTIDKASDWTFSTRYPGTVTASRNSMDELSPTWAPSSGHIYGNSVASGDSVQSPLVPIDYDVLRNMELPILFSSEVILFEDELDDNGVASYKVRIRVMPNCFFILARFFLRVDGVIVRIFDTRYFHRFGSSAVVRESISREGSIPTILKNLSTPVLRDPDIASQKVPTTSTTLENVHLQT